MIDRFDHIVLTVRNQAEVSSARRRARRFGLESPLTLMDIDFLAAELERRRRVGADLSLKAQHPLIEAQRCFERAAIRTRTWSRSAVTMARLGRNALRRRAAVGPTRPGGAWSSRQLLRVLASSRDDGFA